MELLPFLANQGLEKRPFAFMEERGGDLDHLATFWLGSVVREGEDQCLEREGFVSRVFALWGP